MCLCVRLCVCVCVCCAVQIRAEVDQRRRTIGAERSKVIELQLRANQAISAVHMKLGPEAPGGVVHGPWRSDPPADGMFGVWNVYACVCACVQDRASIEQLRAQQEAAIQEEEFELAEQLNDRIAQLTSQVQDNSAVVAAHEEDLKLYGAPR